MSEVKDAGNEVFADRVLARISRGESVRRIALDEGVSERTLRHWVCEGYGYFADSARAKDAGMDSLAEQCIEIADDQEMPSDQKRVRIDTRLRLLGKWSRRYADKVSHEVTMRRAEELNDDELAAIASGANAAATASPPRLSD